MRYLLQSSFPLVIQFWWMVFKEKESRWLFSTILRHLQTWYFERCWCWTIWFSNWNINEFDYLSVCYFSSIAIQIYISRWKENMNFDLLILHFFMLTTITNWFTNIKGTLIWIFDKTVGVNQFNISSIWI